METIVPSPVGSLLGVTAARVRQMVRRSGGLASFDVSDGRSPGVTPRLVELLGEYGRLAYQSCVLSDAPWQIFWSSGRQCFLPFQERRFTLFAFCDPVGPEQSREAAVRQFFEFARLKGKYAVFIFVTESVRRAALEYGCGAIWLGAEIFFDLDQYSLDGKTGRTLRQDIHHMRHLGGTTGELFPLEDEAGRQAIREVELEWKAARLGRYRDSIFGTKPMANAHFRRYFGVEAPAPGGAKLQSFQVCSPVGRGGWSLHDLVRRPGAPRGAAELAAVSAMQAFRFEGFKFVTMGLVPFYEPPGLHVPRQAGSDPDAISKNSPLVRRAIGYWDRLYHFSGMQLFRSKFAPTRAESAYLLYWPPILTPPVLWEAWGSL